MEKSAVKLTKLLFTVNKMYLDFTLDYQIIVHHQINVHSGIFGADIERAHLTL